jgi:NAD(P)-dependent dehydrogenase (short-subunit alcohol dehydrogenase family)
MSSRALGERTILITGGTGGVGLEAARALLARGARVIIGSRDPDRFATAAAELGHEGVHPFIADLINPQQVEREIEILRNRGLRPTDVIHAAAGGMESVLRDLVRLMIGLRGLIGHEKDRAHAAARDELAPLVAASREFALTVNCKAPSQLLDLIVPSMAAGGTVTFYSHLWASLYPHPQVPIYYDAVAESKHAFEGWLERHASEWASHGITTAIISTNLIGNTRMGSLLDRFCAEPMPAADRLRWRSSFVNCSDIVDATLGVIDRAADGSQAGLVWLFIPTPGELTDQVGPDHPAVSHPVALALNAPVWSEASVRSGT